MYSSTGLEIKVPTSPVTKTAGQPLTALILLFIVLLAAFLRMERPALAEFKLDEAGDTCLALRIAYEGWRPVIGARSSLGTAHLPLNLYLLALPLRLWNDPVAGVLWFGFLDALAVWLCYHLGKTNFNPRVGLMAALLFAVNPWAILYARKVWSTGKPLLVLLLLTPLLAAAVQRRYRALPAACLGLVAVIGMHWGGLAFLPLAALAVWFCRERAAWKPLAVGVGLALLAFSPFLLHEAQNGWRDLRILLGYGGGAGAFSWDALLYALRLSSAAGIEGQAGAFHAAFRQSLPDLWWTNALVSGLLIAAVFYTAYRAWRGAPDERRLNLLLLLWWSLPILLQLRPGKPTQPHYFVILYPVQFLLLARLVDRVCEVLSRRRAPALAAAILVCGLLVCGWQMSITFRLRETMLAHPSTGGYGIPLYYPRLAAQQARQLASGAEVFVLSRESRPLLTETPTVFDALLFGHPHRFADGRSALPLPEAPAVVYLVGPLPDPELDPLLTRLDSLPHTRPGPRVQLPDGLEYRLFRREWPDRTDLAAAWTPLGGGIPFANKVVFAGYESEAQATPGQPLVVWLAWWLQGPPPPGDYHFTVQLLDAVGAVRAQHDHAGFPADFWRGGDLALYRFALPLPANLPPGEYRLRAGMYTYPDIIGVPVVDPQGNSIDSGVDLGVVSISDYN